MIFLFVAAESKQPGHLDGVSSALLNLSSGGVDVAFWPLDQLYTLMTEECIPLKRSVSSFSQWISFERSALNQDAQGDKTANS